MSHELKDRNRRNVTLFTSKTGEVLPLYYEQDNSKLISLLEEYYKFMDSSGDLSFSNTISEIHHSRDISQTDLDYLDELIKEIGNGLQASAFFAQPRLMTKLLASFYRAKGSVVSLEGFFRGFFNEEVSVEYPKEQIFIVAESEIGFESQRFIQDNGLYQIFSILVKVGLSTQEYENLYKRFVHPAGFHFAGQVEMVGNANLSLAVASENPLDSAVAFELPLIDEATLEVGTGITEFTILLDSNGTDLRATPNINVNTFASDSVGSLNEFYPNIATLLTPNSFTFDDSTGTEGPDTSMDYETMDGEMFTRYLANILDSSI